MSPRLTATMLNGLAHAGKAGRLRRFRSGWGELGIAEVATHTVNALVARGLLRLEPLSGCMGEAVITMEGRRALEANGLDPWAR